MDRLIIITAMILCVASTFFRGNEEKTIIVHQVDTVFVGKQDTLTDWDMLILAIAMKESRLDSTATGSADDLGILQLRPVYVREANRVSGENYAHEDAYGVKESIRMFNLVQGYHNPLYDHEKAIKLHNPGASPAYRGAVLENLEIIKRYETIRKQLISYER